MRIRFASLFGLFLSPAVNSFCFLLFALRFVSFALFPAARGADFSLLTRVYKQGSRLLKQASLTRSKKEKMNPSLARGVAKCPLVELLFS